MEAVEIYSSWTLLLDYVKRSMVLSDKTFFRVFHWKLPRASSMCFQPRTLCTYHMFNRIVDGEFCARACQNCSNKALCRVPLLSARFKLLGNEHNKLRTIGILRLLLWEIVADQFFWIYFHVFCCDRTNKMQKRNMQINKTHTREENGRISNGISITITIFNANQNILT